MESEFVEAMVPPNGFRRSRNNGKTTIVWRWNRNIAIPLFLIVWLLMAGTLVFTLISKLNDPGIRFRRPEPLLKTIQEFVQVVWNSQESWAIFFLLTLLLVMAVFLAVIYVIVAQLINRITLSLDHSAVTISHAPVPWFSPPSPINLSTVKSFSTERRRSLAKPRTTRYQLLATLHNQQRVVLTTLKNIGAEKEVSFLAHELNCHLQKVQKT